MIRLLSLITIFLGAAALLLLAACAREAGQPAVPSATVAASATAIAGPTTTPRPAPVIRMTLPASPGQAAADNPDVNVVPVLGADVTQQLIQILGDGYDPQQLQALQNSAAQAGVDPGQMVQVITNEDGSISVIVFVPAELIGGDPANIHSSVTISNIEELVSEALAGSSDLPVEQLTATTAADEAAIYREPGEDSPLVTVVGQGESLLVIGRDAEGSWIRVRLPGGFEGWIATSKLEMPFEFGQLPVME